MSKAQLLSIKVIAGSIKLYGCEDKKNSNVKYLVIARIYRMLLLILEVKGRKLLKTKPILIWLDGLLGRKRQARIFVVACCLGTGFGV